MGENVERMKRLMIEARTHYEGPLSQLYKKIESAKNSIQGKLEMAGATNYKNIPSEGKVPSDISDYQNIYDQVQKHREICAKEVFAKGGPWNNTPYKKAKSEEAVLKTWPRMRPVQDFTLLHRLFNWLRHTTYVIEYATAHRQLFVEETNPDSSKFLKPFFEAYKLRQEHRRALRKASGKTRPRRAKKEGGAPVAGERKEKIVKVIEKARDSAAQAEEAAQEGEDLLTNQGGTGEKSFRTGKTPKMKSSAKVATKSSLDPQYVKWMRENNYPF